MRKVTVIHGNSYSQVKGLDTEKFRKLRKILSYKTDPQAAYFSGGWARTKYLIDAKGNFPSGLWIRVYKFLETNNIEYQNVSNTGLCPHNEQQLFKLKLPYKPHKWQEDVMNLVKTYGRGGIVAPTGTGKSLVIALIAARLNVRTLIVVPTLEIKKQLSESLIELFGVNNNIMVQNIDNVLLRNYKDFDCLIIDECHHVAAKTYQKLNKEAWGGIYHRFFLTATFFRNNASENLLFEGIAGEIIYRLSYKEAIEKKYIVPVEAYYIDVPKQTCAEFKYAEVYNKLIVMNSLRNTIISKLLQTLHESNIYTLCLVKELKHGHLLEMMSAAPFVNGQDESTRPYIPAFVEGRLKRLIGTTGILGEGVDTKPAEYIIIAGLGKAKSAFLQQIGRGVRIYPGKESCKIILFRDASHKFTLRHYREQCKILRDELGIVPLKLEVT